MTVELLIQKFYTDLMTVERLSSNTAATYSEGAVLFLRWLVNQQLKLKEVTTQNIIYYFAQRRTEGVDELTVAKQISDFSSRSSGRRFSSVITVASPPFPACVSWIHRGRDPSATPPLCRVPPYPDAPERRRHALRSLGAALSRCLPLTP